ncbi:uncharacterized protein LOC116977393 [Amblyraja radiata]|uniref:uncharacterized protein LOC116977393 n=1 Tax=Amblyraja radiata TaxID=386614 RepID=UPI00140294D8|nr:uncharacterized protein LOC116977393 [Amblyraja radiata]
MIVLMVELAQEANWSISTHRSYILVRRQSLLDHWQLQPEVEFKCRDLDVSTITISSHLLNTTRGKNKETKTCMYEDHFDYLKGKCSSQDIVAKDLNKCAQDSVSTTESTSGKYRLAPLVTKHATGLHNSNIETAIASNIQCGNHVLSMTSRQLADNQLNDPTHETESNSVMSECRDPCSRQPLKACETSTIKQPSAFNLEGKLPTCSKNGSNCLETLREEEINWKENIFQVEGTVRKRGLDSRILTVQESTECSTRSQTNEDGQHIARPLDSQVNSKSVQELANFAGLSARYFAMCPVQDPLDVVSKGVNIYPGNSKNNFTNDILQSLSKARMQGRRQSYQLARISLLEDKSTSLETQECISLMDQQRFGHTNSVAAAMLLPAFRPYPSKQTLHRNKGTTKLQNQAKCLQYRL